MKGINNMNYSCSSTQSYRCGFIHSAYVNGHWIVRAQVDGYAYPIQLKSIHAAKILITKHFKKKEGIK
jgi:hypothetical protein